jgi:hypothetical protein
VTGITTTANQTDIDTRRSLVDVLKFLSRSGASTEVIQLAMVRGGISIEVARILAQCVASTPMAPPALPAPMGPRKIDGTGRAAEIALQKITGLVIYAGIIWGVGIALGFAIGMEMGFAQGVEDGLDRVRQLVGL